MTRRNIFTKLSIIVAGATIMVNTTVLNAQTRVVPEVVHTKWVNTRFIAVNSAGLAGVPSSSDGHAELKLFLFDEYGLPLQGATGGICPSAGCIFILDAGKKLNISLESIAVSNAGGFTGLVHAWALIIVGGPGADAVNLLTLIHNDQTGSTFAVVPEEVKAAASP
jgi:hypothetical protein